MGLVYIGTSGYDYPEWRGVLYPPELPREEFLACYSRHFNALELNFSYYGMPDERQMDSMVKRSGGLVHFSVKAHRSLTHSVDVSSWRESARTFRQALLPMVNRGLLLSVLLQFPQSFHYAVDERRYLDSLTAEFSDLPLIVEFRHASWQNPRVWDGLRSRGIGWCICDLPELRNLPANTQIVTASSAYLRFHGRNSAAWHGTDARDRYDYLYTDSDLESYAPVVASLTSSSEVLQIYFNNHAKGHAVVNARRMQILAEQATRTLPHP